MTNDLVGGTDNINIVPIVICGGQGTRLWPVSTSGKPKQFHKFGDCHSLFQQSVLRTQSPIFNSSPIIVGAFNNLNLIKSDLEELHVTADIILEPSPKNTCAAITAGCLQALARYSHDVVVLIIAADHYIPDNTQFSKEIILALPMVFEGRLTAFGVQPQFPATGYGYIEPGTQLKDPGNFIVNRFTEKPPETVAKILISQGCLWNSGNFLFKAIEFLDELQRYQPKILNSVSDAYFSASLIEKCIKLDEEHFEKSPSLSVDKAIMEKTKRAAVRRVKYDWSDMGSWQSVWRLNEKNKAGNSISGLVDMNDCQDCLVISDMQTTKVNGLQNIVVVAENNEILVSTLDKSKSIAIKPEPINIASDEQTCAKNSTNKKPWGRHERLSTRNSYQVKRLVINPGGVLSLQKHEFRSEHWIVVKGTLEITIDDQINNLEENQSAYIPAGSLHRIRNQTNEIAVLIEVQTGTYFGEDDIIRLDDIYDRKSDQMCD